MMLKWVAIAFAAAILAAVVVCMTRAGGGGGSSVQVSPGEVGVAKSGAAVDRLASAKPEAAATAATKGAKDGSAAAQESAAKSRHEASRAAQDAVRREYEAFKKMSPEEQMRFRKQRREERLRKRMADEMAERDRQRQAASREVVKSASGGAQAPRGDDAVKTAQSEDSELRAAALKARAEYEESMGEAAAANYRRRSVGYWIERVRRQRERTAARTDRGQPGDTTANTGVGAAGKQNKENTTKGTVE